MRLRREAAETRGVLWLKRHRAGVGVSENEFWAAMWALLLGALLGAKALFVALGWEHYVRGELSFWADFQVGFVFFGGLAGALFAGVRGLDFVPRSRLLRRRAAAWPRARPGRLLLRRLLSRPGWAPLAAL